MSNIIKKSFGINLTVLRVLSLYSYKTTESTRCDKLVSWTMYILFCLHIPILGILYYLLEENIDMQNLGDSTFIVAQLSCFLGKLVPFITKKDQITKCIYHLESSIFEPLRDKHMNIIDKNSNICTRNSTVYLTSVGCSLFILSIKPLFLEPYKLPVDIWFPFELTKNSKGFWCLYIYVILGKCFMAVKPFWFICFSFVIKEWHILEWLLQ